MRPAEQWELPVLAGSLEAGHEVIGERIRDSFAASRKRGMWMGGLEDRRLVVVEREAATVRRIFDRFTRPARRPRWLVS